MKQIFKKISKRTLGRDPAMLTGQIRQKKKEAGTWNWLQWIKGLVTELYVPSLASFFIVTALVVIGYFIAHYLPSAFSQVGQADSHYQNFIAIHAGIGTIIFALIIFVAESLRDDDETYRARVLLRESFLFPLTVAEILVFFIFIWGEVSFWSIIPLGLVGLFTIWSLSRIINIMLNSHSFAQSRSEVLKERLKRSIDLAISERLGDNILFQQLDGKDIKLQFGFLSFERHSELHRFSANKLGTIVDINMRKLKDLAELVEEQAKEKGFAFIDEEKTQTDPRAQRQDGVADQVGKVSYTPNTKRYIMKKFHDEVSEEHNTLIAVDKKLIDDKEILSRVEGLVGEIFIIKRFDNFTKEVKYDLSRLKDKSIDLMSKRHLGKLDELVEVYVDLAEAFLETMEQYGGGFTSEQAQKERGSIGGGWEQIHGLTRDIRELFLQAIATHDRDVIQMVGFLPFLIARRAIDNRDHYLFQEFVNFASGLYGAAVKENKVELKEFMVDRSWRYLKEICDYYVESKMKNDRLDKSELENLKDFGVYFFKVFQTLLKQAFEHKDLDSFNDFLHKGTLKLFDHFDPHRDMRSTEHLKWEMQREGLSDQEKEKLKKRLEQQKVLEDIEKEIKERRLQMLFGLASWIFKKFWIDQSKENRIFYQTISTVLPSELEDLTKLFMGVHEFEVEDFWGWGWWDMNTEGEVQSIKTLEQLERLYVVKALAILATKTKEEIQEMELPTSRDLAYLAEGVRDLKKTVDAIEQEPGKWKFVLSDQATRMTPALRGLLEKAKIAQEKKEIEYKQVEPISKVKIREFKDEVIVGYYKSVNLRKLFQYLELYEDKTVEVYTKGTDRFGINTVDDKAVFFEGWHVHYGNHGEQYGESASRGEDSDLFDEISTHCRTLPKADIDKLIGEYEQAEDLIILTTHAPLYSFFGRSTSFEPEWHKDTPKMENAPSSWEGWYKHENIRIPVFHGYHKDITDKILILNRKKLGSLVQYSPLNNDEKSELMKDIFYVNVQAFSEDRALLDKFIQKPPDWLKEIGNQDQQRGHLLEKVLIQIYERFEFCRHKDFEGYVVEFR